jgi:hypothetical protein
MITGHVARMEKTRSTRSVSVRRPVEKRSHGRPNRTRKHNIMMELREIRIYSLSFFGISWIARSGSATVVLVLIIIIIIIAVVIIIIAVIIIIIIMYVCAESTATRPITDTAHCS